MADRYEHDQERRSERGRDREWESGRRGWEDRESGVDRSSYFRGGSGYGREESGGPRYDGSREGYFGGSYGSQSGYGSEPYGNRGDREFGATGSNERYWGQGSGGGYAGSIGRESWGRNYRDHGSFENQGRRGYQPNPSGQGYEQGGRYTEGWRGSERSYGVSTRQEHYPGSPWNRESGNYGEYGSQAGFSSTGGLGGYTSGSSGFGSSGSAGGMGGYGERQTGRYQGRGPKNYSRSDDRIKEDINEHLTQHHDIDATEIEVHVQHGEVTLRGTVDNRNEKRLAEDVAENVSGVKDVKNELRVQSSHQRGEHVQESSQSTGAGAGRAETAKTAKS